MYTLEHHLRTVLERTPWPEPAGPGQSATVTVTLRVAPSGEATVTDYQCKVDEAPAHDWSRAPAWAMWRAQQPDGDWWWYERDPRWHAKGWRLGPGRAMTAGNTPNLTPWAATLQHRPIRTAVQDAQPQPDKGQPGWSPPPRRRAALPPEQQLIVADAAFLESLKLAAQEASGRPRPAQRPLPKGVFYWPGGDNPFKDRPHVAIRVVLLDNTMATQALYARDVTWSASFHFRPMADEDGWMPHAPGLGAPLGVGVAEEVLARTSAGHAAVAPCNLWNWDEITEWKLP